MNHLIGGTRSDTLYGGAGKDILLSGTGADQFGNTIIRGGTDGDSAAEFEILIPRTVTLTASDFIL